MKGIICLWSGAIVDIPAGWKLCDGNNGTPDLRNKFVIGAGDTYAPEDTGGATSHDHEFTGIAHAHTFAAGIILEDVGPAGDVDFNTTSVAADGTVESETELPPYFALCYIMKIP